LFGACRLLSPTRDSLSERHAIEDALVILRILKRESLGFRDLTRQPPNQPAEKLIHVLWQDLKPPVRTTDGWRTGMVGFFFERPFFDNARGAVVSGRCAKTLNHRSPRRSQRFQLRQLTGCESDQQRRRHCQGPSGGRKIAAQVGFAFTELAWWPLRSRNWPGHRSLCAEGEIAIQPVTNSTVRGIQIVAQDQGPGIRDVEQALQIGFSTSGGLGLDFQEYGA